MNIPRGQLTARGIAIGCIGCAIITAASAYTALKMGALPWPIIFAAIVSLFFLKALGNSSLNEANVTHTIMSSGAMVAGGLAFTIPGIWIITGENPVSFPEMLVVALAGVILGLICTAYLRRRFIEIDALEYPIGEAAARTLEAGEVGGTTGTKLFGALGIAGAYTALRDGLALIPTIFFGSVSISGVSFGLYNSPMLIAVGFIAGTASVVVWFIGALISNFGIIVGSVQAGIWDVSTAQDITQSLGMGVMMGCGMGVIIKEILPRVIGLFGRSGRGGRAQATSMKEKVADANGQGAPTQDCQAEEATGSLALKTRRWTAGMAACVSAAVALLLCFVLGLSPLACVIIVLFSWITCAMASQSVGQTGVDPMEIFGLIVLLIVAATSEASMVQLFFVAAVIAVACGLAGDVMNDFKAGYILGTDVRAQWLGQAIGGIVGAFVAAAVMFVLIAAYGADAFGVNGQFIAAQASVVATMVSGIPSVPAFLIGLVAGCVLFMLKVPVMMLGLGIYLPFYMSAAAFLGALIKVTYDRICAACRSMLSPDVAESKALLQDESGLVIASGFIGGESVIGVIIAFISVVSGLAA